MKMNGLETFPGPAAAPTSGPLLAAVTSLRGRHLTAPGTTGKGTMAPPAGPPEKFGWQDAKHILATPGDHARFMAIKYAIQAATGTTLSQWDLMGQLLDMYERLSPVKATMDRADGAPHSMPEVIDTLVEVWETT